MTVRLTPMQPLSAIVAAAAEALSPPIADPSTTCVLKVNGKVLSPAELGTPIRFANLSASTTRFELLTGRERGLGGAGGVVATAAEKRAEAMTTSGSMATEAGPSSTSSAAVPAGPPPPAPVVPPPAPTATATAAAGEASSSVAFPSPPPPPPPAAAAAAATNAAPPPSPPPPPLPPRAPLPPPTRPADPAVVLEASVRSHLSASDGGVEGLGLEEVAVFSRDDLEKAAAEARGGVPLDVLASPSSTPDSFYEFTAEDYRAVLGSYRGRHEAAASAPLRTSQQRAAEAAARAAAAGDVRLRVHFSDRSILQFRLPATAPLGVLREVVSRALERRIASNGGGGGGASTSAAAAGASTSPSSASSPSSSSSAAPAHLAPWEWEIYTAPPKTVLRLADDARETLFSLGLSPAANVHCGPASVSSGSGSGSGAAAKTTTPKEAPRLRPELLALRRSGVVSGAADAARKADAKAKAEEEEEAKGKQSAGGGGGGAKAAVASSSDGSGKKGKAGMPKWMKMGK